MDTPIDFTTAKRLHPVGIFLSGIKSFIQFLKTMGIAALIILVQKSSFLFTAWFWLGLLFILLLIIIYAYLSFRNFTYHIDPDNKEFVLQKGILNKERIVIKFDKIIQINIVQNIFQQALDVYSVQVESSGSDETEIDLYALDEVTAIALKNYILVLKGDGTTLTEENATNTANTPQLIFELKARDILLVSLFSNYRQGMLLFFAFLITVYNQVADFLFEDGFEGYFEGFNVSDFISKIAIVLLFIFCIPILINLVRYFFTYYNFRLNRNAKGVLNMQYGLFNLKDLIFNRNKVQLAITTQNYILKKLKLNIVTLQQVLTDSQKVESSLIHLPGISDDNKNILFDILYDKKFDTAKVFSPAINLFISRSIKACLFFLVLALAGIILYQENKIEIASTISLLFLLTIIYHFIYYKNLKLYQYEDFIVKRAGVWDIRETIIPIDNVTAVAVGQTIWQVRNNLGYIDISTASGSIRFNFFDLGSLNRLVNRTLYKVEQ